MFIALIMVLVTIIVYNALPDEVYEKVTNCLKDTAKWCLICGITVAVFLAMFIFLPPANGEELPEEFYYKVVFIDEIEEIDEDELLIHTDDLDHLWDYYEQPYELIVEIDDYKSNLALQFALENNLHVELSREELLCRGRIVVLTMWIADPEDPFDEEVVDVYYTEFVTDVEV